ncbi:unnamed protein product [Somion occarium]
MIAKYSARLPLPQDASVGPRPREELVVLLTGSTGALGADFLAALIGNNRVAHVYSLNRSPNVVDRQRVALERRELDPGIVLSKKLTSLEGDVSKADLGLSSETFDELKRTVTHIVHNAWRVNFNAPLSSFGGYIEGTCNLLRLAATSSHAAQFLYTSSLGIAQGWRVEDGIVPENAHWRPEAALTFGYTRSKYVVEHLLSKAAKSGLPATTLRLGQVCGSSATGAWPTTEWVPILVKSSIALGCLPLHDTILYWLPSDTLAAALLDYITTQEPLPELLTIIHPRPIAWKDIIGSISDALGQLPIVSFPEWFAKLEAISKNASAEDLERIPALKLMPFFRSTAHENATGRSRMVPKFESKNAQKFSETLRNEPPVSHEHAHAWVNYWKRCGFIPSQSAELHINSKL